MVHGNSKFFPMSDADFMDRALALAERGRGHVEPNPLVGAVVARDGVSVGEGWHEKYGLAHAEVNALARAGEAARGATLYVTLEPCCHHGKTPPCTDAVLRSGVRRVVAAMLDPFPQVSGKGAARLREAGVAVEVGLGGPAAHRLNAPYLTRLRAGRPWVHAKWAMTLDGKIASFSGLSKWVTGAAARAKVHELRGLMDAIIVGRGTLIADDPLLTARPSGPRTAARVVLTSGKESLPGDCQLLRTIDQAQVLVVTAKGQLGNYSSWSARGAELLGFAADAGGVNVAEMLKEFAKRGMTNVLVEGGAGVLGAFLDARLIDEVHVYIAPKLLGGARALSPIGGRGIADMAEALKLAEWDIERVGDDVLIHGRVTHPSPE
jgi:diaminohydroxyphosphoribosylaminopyrimidine deaminase/5-amino-6-(5-phosphoribosylamino)uracil reductase